MRKSGNSVRISAHLSRADTGELLWSESFTRHLSDVFAVQTELAQIIVERLGAQLGGRKPDTAAMSQIHAQVRAAVRGGTQNVEAYQHYLKGQFLAKQISDDYIARAITAFRRAVELDPEFALAWAALSITISRRQVTESSQATIERQQEARRAADRALVLEPELSEALLARGTLQFWYDYDWRGAEVSVRRVLEMAPFNPMALELAAAIANMTGSPDRATALLRQGVELDPLNEMNAAMYALSLANSGRLTEAEAEYRRGLEINPTQQMIHAVLGVVVMRQGRLKEAAVLIQRETDDVLRSWGLAQLHWAQGNQPESDAALLHMEEAYGEIIASGIAQIHAYRGDVDKAFAWLDRAYRQREDGLTVMVQDWHFQDLRGDPRWVELWRRLGLPSIPYAALSEPAN